MVNGGDADAGGIQRETGGEQSFHRGEGGNAVFFSGCVRAGRVAIDDGCEFNRGTGRLHLAVDAEVVAAEGSGADDRYS